MNESRAVLIVDDSDDDVAAFERFLRDEPAIQSVFTASTGDDGLESYQAERPDCVLLDYSLPGRNGLEVLRRLKSLDRFATVVMTTGQGNEEIASKSIKMGAVDYLAKDRIDSSSLRQSIARSIDTMAVMRRMARQEEEQRLFLDVLVHDAGAPLRQIRAFSDQLVADIRAGDYDDVLEQGAAVAKATTRMQNLLAMLGDYALSDKPATFETIDMTEIAQDAVENLADKIEQHQVTIEYDQLPSINGHRAQLIQLLQNLIGNAIKYNRSDVPTVYITAIPKIQTRHEWLFEIRDNGMGIPTDRSGYVFEPFKRLWTQDDYEGTGLGLAICKRIVERHEGQIWFESDGQNGTSFYFTLASSEDAEGLACLTQEATAGVRLTG